MPKNTRQNEILEILKQEKFVSVAELSRRLYASQPTIRRDLTYLASLGLIRRSHGGVIPADDKNNLPVSFRNGTQTAEKIRICRLAASLISPGELIFTDASTTALRIGEFLKQPQDVTLLTNGLLACKLFSDKGARVCATGGVLLKDSLAFVGGAARQTVLRYHADSFFFSSSSLGEDGVISDYSEEETELRRCMAEQAARCIFLCDSGKFASRSTHRLFSLERVDAVITGEPLPQALSERYRLVLVKSKDAFLYERQ